MTLTCNFDSLTLSRNQVNVPISTMPNPLHSLGARICRVSFFGMKWEIPDAEPMIHRFIQRYHAEMGSFVATDQNFYLHNSNEDYFLNKIFSLVLHFNIIMNTPRNSEHQNNVLNNFFK